MGPLVVSAVALAFATSSPDNEPVTSPTVEASQPTPTEQLIGQYFDQMFANKYDEASKIADQLHVDGANGDAVAMVTAMRAMALLGLKQDAKAHQLIAEVARIAPKSPEPSRTLFLGGLITKQFDVSADALDRLIEGHPDTVRNEDSDYMNFFLRHEPKGEERRNENRRIALARIGYGGDTAAGHWRAVEAINILVKRGDFSAAGELLQSVREPEPIEDMLSRSASRRFGRGSSKSLGRTSMSCARRRRQAPNGPILRRLRTMRG